MPILLAMLAASQAPSAQMRAAIAAKVGDKLLDGESARYRWPMEDPAGDKGYCGFVNGKNTYGAYVGWRPFFIIGLHGKGGQFIAVSADVAGTDDDTSTGVVSKMCADAGFDLSVLPEESAPSAPAPAARRSTGRRLAPAQR